MTVRAIIHAAPAEASQCRLTKQMRTMPGAAHRSLENQNGKSVTRVGEGTPARWAIADQR